MKKKNIKEEMINKISNRLIAFAQKDIKEVFALLDISERGLSSEEAELRLKDFGPNQIAHEKPSPWFVQLLKAFFNPFIGVLLFLAGVSLLMDVILAAPKIGTGKPLLSLQ